MRRITITAGTGEDRHGQPLDANVRDAALAEIRATLAGTFGGYTESETLGGWVNDDGELVTETGRQWVALTPDRTPEDKARDVAERARAALRQESVVLQIEDVYAAFVTERVMELG